MGRKIGIWVFGLLASAIIGALIGQKLDYADGGAWGFLGGIFTFACIRLWLTPGQNAKK